MLRLTASHGWRLYTAAVGIALEAKLSGLPCTQGAVPTEIGRRIRITTRHSRIPRVGQAVAARVLPARRPTGFAAGAGIGHADNTGESTAPGVGNHIGTTQPHCSGRTAG